MKRLRKGRIRNFDLRSNLTHHHEHHVNKVIDVTEISMLDQRIEVIVDRTKQQYPSWPCRRGCDACCRRLSESPRITEAEWNRLAGLIATLESKVRDRIYQGIAEVRGQKSPVICPMLDREEGACLVYPARPLACRTYGYYDQRGIGIYCPDIESEVRQGRFQDVIWGNQDVMDRDQSCLGPLRALDEWLASDLIESGS